MCPRTVIYVYFCTYFKFNTGIFYKQHKLKSNVLQISYMLKFMNTFVLSEEGLLFILRYLSVKNNWYVLMFYQINTIPQNGPLITSCFFVTYLSLALLIKHSPTVKYPKTDTFNSRKCPFYTALIHFEQVLQKPFTFGL